VWIWFQALIGKLFYIIVFYYTLAFMISKSAALLLRSKLVSSGNGVEILDICPIHIQASLDREMKALMRKRIIFLITVFGLLFVGGTALALNSPSID
jgi:predicted MPP superfamily phosphohydrolase